jgi:radical SAM superfamily enzyme YgiQ (UPF0313 family)
MFIENDIKIPWGCELRIDNLTDEEAHLLKIAGCRLVASGIESANIEVLKKNLKYQNLEGVKEGIFYLKKYEIPIQAYFVLGLPGETIETFNETIEFIKNLPFNENDRINYFMATPYPGSRLWSEQEDFSIKIIESDFSKYDCQHIIFETAKLEKKTLRELYIKAKKIELYYQKKN